jgi:hypothetical protein
MVRLTREHILPANLSIPAFEDIFVHSARATQRSRPPLACFGDLEFHTPSHRLRNAKLTPQHFHLHTVLRVAPLD